LGLIDDVVPEPLGGAHRDTDAMAATLKRALNEAIDSLASTPIERLLENRNKRIMGYGEYQEN
jgi:acetyl-CoA carboxylase carboxyl transferase subunit alpha